MNWHCGPAAKFERYRAQWDRLNAAGPDSPVLHADFIAAGLRCFGDGNEWLAVWSAGDDVRAMALLRRRRPGVWETFQPSQWPLGPWLSVGEPPLGRLAGALPGPVLMLGLTQLDPDFYARPPDDSRLDTLDYITTARIGIDGSFEQYWAQRGRNLRHNLKRQRNSLQRQGTVLRLETITASAQVAAAVRDFGALESAGWKAATGTAVGTDDAQGRFYQAVLTDFCARRAGRIYRYWYDDRLVASDLCIQNDTTLVILKTAYDETVQTSSPAMLMRQDYFERIFSEQRIKTIEFYGKVMDWHERMSSDRRLLYHVNYFAWPCLKSLYRRMQHWRYAAG